MEKVKKRIVTSIFLQLMLSELHFEVSGSPYVVENRNCGKGNNCYQKESEPNGYKVCGTEECYKTAESYKQLLNFSVSPCDDMYAFACPRDTFGTLGTLILNRQKAVEEVLLTPVIVTPKRHLENVKAIFQKCLQSGDVSKEDLVAAVKTALRNTGGMPMIPDTGYVPGLSWERRFGIFLRQSKKNPLFKFQAFERDNLVVIMHVPKFLIELSTGEGSVQEQILSWKTETKTKICFLKGESKNCMEDKNLDEEIDNVFKFEVNLMQITRSAHPNVDFLTSPVYIAVEELTKTFSEFNWVDFFTELFKETGLSITERTPFVVSDKQILKRIFSFIAGTEKQTIGNYLGLFTIDMFPLMSTPAFSKYLRQDRDTKLIPDYCYEEIVAIFPYSVARIFSEKYFKLDDRKEVIKLIYNLKQAMADVLLEKDWMGEETKRRAVKKAVNMEFYVGYPAWIFDDKELEAREAIGYIKCNNSFHTTLWKVYNCKKRNTWTQFITSNVTEKRKTLINQDTEFSDGGPSEFNVHYSTLNNMLQISVGALRHPLYSRDNLPSITYGSLGFALGHEITHGFDVDGILHDESGSENDWFSKAMEEYQKRIQCYRDYFSSIVDDLTKLHLDGNKTLGENMADIGGLRRAYSAYMKLKAEDVRLPGLESVDHKQLFFISGARLFCEDEHNHRSAILTANPHTPGKYRVLLTLKNFQPFAEAFNCPVGSPMNPEKRCPMSK